MKLKAPEHVTQKIVKGKKRERIKNDTIKRENREQFEREENLVLD